jgi:hypothetical protein
MYRIQLSILYPRLTHPSFPMFFLLLANSHARMTPEQKRIINEKAEEADKAIHFGNFETIDAEIQKHKTFLIFFGANWCSNTQKYFLHSLDLIPNIYKSSSV